MPSEFRTVLCKESIFQHDSTAGWSCLDQTMADDQISSEIVRDHDCEIAGIIANKQSYQALVPPLYERCLSDAEFDIMTEMYCVLYPCVDIVWISRFYKETKKVIINGEEYLSLKSRSERSAVISARWVGNNGIDQTGNEPSHVGSIRSLFEHTISIIPQGTSEIVPISLTHVLAKVVWYESHSEPLWAINYCSIICATSTHKSKLYPNITNKSTLCIPTDKLHFCIWRRFCCYLCSTA